MAFQWFTNFKNSRVKNSNSIAYRVGGTNGHPIDNFMQENRYAEQLLKDMKKILRRLLQQPFQADWNQLFYLSKELNEIEIHYRKIEEALFPFFESSHLNRLDEDFSDRYREVKRCLKDFSQAVKGRNADVHRLFYEVNDLIRQIITDEDQILFPTALSYLSLSDWDSVRSVSASVGAPWFNGSDKGDSKRLEGGASLEGFRIEGGALTLSVIESLLDSLMVELTVFNQDGVVVYYNGGNRRRHPRRPDIIGKPLKEVFSGKNFSHIKKIITALKNKKQPYVEFWFPEAGRQIYTKYVPLFTREGVYNGVLEMIVDVTDFQGMTGTYSGIV